MRNLLYFKLIAFCILLAETACTNKMEVLSPNQQNILSLSLNSQGELFYEISNQGETLVKKSLIGITTDNEQNSFNQGLQLTAVESKQINEEYSIPTGKTRHYINHANEKVFTFSNQYGEKMILECRAYNDGIAFRYNISGTDITIKKENTEITLPTGSKSWMMDWVRHYENYYPERLIDTISTPTEFLFPVLIQKSKAWMLMTEAAVYDMPAIHLSKKPLSSTFHLEFAKEDSSFIAENGYKSSWKTFILGKNLGEIVESTLVENLNPPSRIDNTEWITPGVAVFPWWGDHLANSYIDTLKMYVDLAESMKWEWLEFDVSLINTPLRASKEWETVSWIPELVEYAAQKGIKVYGWDEIKTLDNKKGRDYVFSRYKEMGIKGIKIDYIDSDSQYAMKFRDTVCAEAAKYGLMVSFHGETLPRGHRRKYPNIMTNEAVKGAEYYTFKGYPCANSRHNCTLPFTRNVVGSMDYTPVTFTIREENPRTTTYCHELALAFAFESGWVCMADRPQAYLTSPARPVLEKIEAAWDETHFIDGYPGEYFCVARKKGNKWFMAAINSEQKRTINIPLSFLPQGKYDLVVYNDETEGDLNSCAISTLPAKSNTETVTLPLMPNGGCVIDVLPVQ